MTKTFMLAQAFEELVERIFESNGFKVERTPRSRDTGVDFVMKSPNGDTIVVECKVSRSSIIPRGDILRMIAQVTRAGESHKASRSILVVAGSLGIPVTDIGTADVIDLKKLREMAAVNPRLVSELESLMRELAPLPTNDFDAHSYLIFGDAYVASDAPPPPPPLPQGEELADKLKAVKPGKKGARDFELKCFDVLKYLFEDDFSNWSKQKVTDSGISRYDVIARISSEHSFWKSIVQYFRSWYVVFEFKNFTQRISQGQIYTTEKYLFLGGMRTVAFVISRKGGDKNSLAATRGAVRESGKLIIHLSLDDIYKMLEMKDKGDNPNDYLFDILDDMLMKLER
jgi:Restriction endonuclease